MQKMTTFNLFLVSFGISMASASTSFAGDKTWVGKTFYTQVNIKAKADRGDGHYLATSTNFIGFKELVPLNSECVVKAIDEDDSIDLSCKGVDMPLHIDFVKKHSLMSFDDYLKKMISEKPVDTKGLTKRELELIKGGDFELGMSKRALLLSLGFPPRSLTGNVETAKFFVYQKMRFNKYRFDFDDKDKLEKIKN